MKHAKSFRFSLSNQKHARALTSTFRKLSSAWHRSQDTRCLATLATKNAAQLFIGHGIWPSRSNLLYKLSKLIVTFYLEIFRCTSKILCQVVYCSVQDPITRSINLFRQSSGISTKGTVEQIQQEGRHKAPLYT